MRTLRFPPLLLPIVLLQLSAVSQATVRVVEQGVRHLRLQYDPGGPWEQSTQQCLIGVPTSGDISMRVVAELTGPVIDAVPVPGGEGLQAGLAFQGPAHLGAPGYLRDQRVANLTFGPTSIPGGRLQTYERVVVELEFAHNATVTNSPSGDRWGEEMYRGCLINYEQARKWRQRRTAPVMKQLSEQFGGPKVRMTVREQGMHRVTGEDLAELGIDLAEVDSGRLRVLYGAGLSLRVTRSEEYSELREIPIVVEDGQDGSFDQDDYLLFYGESIQRWAYLNSRLRYVRNNYTHDNVYWLDVKGVDAGLRASVRSGTPVAMDPQVPGHYRARIHAESENFIQLQSFGINSGYAWYWHNFRGNARNFNPVLYDVVVDEPVDLVLRMFAAPNKWGNYPENQFDVRWNGDSIAQISSEIVPSFGGSYEVGGVREGVNTIGLFHSGHGARLDWYEIVYSRRYVARDGALVFDSPVLEGTAEYRLEGFIGERPRLFEFSERLTEIEDFEHDAEAGTLTFQDETTGDFHRYTVAGPSHWKRPIRLELDAEDVLRSSANGADYIIITHKDFASAAERLAAWRGQDDRFGAPLIPMVVDIRDIYDEFSGGVLDPTAIRNFLTYAANNWSIKPSFINLFGDGTYDYKNNWGTSHENWIPPYQDGGSTYDEWYVRVNGDDPFPDMAIGRITVQSLEEADIVVDKLITYDREPEVGPWQNRALIVADDLSDPSLPGRLETYFLTDTELLVNSFLPKEMDLVKHYIAQFPLQGQSKPRAREEFIRLFNEGAVLFTYVGHGNPDVLAHEQMFVMSRDIERLQNKGRLPFTYLAASQVGVFDDPFLQSMPEALLSKRDGGVIGMISATRIGHHLSNMILANHFHEQMFMTDRAHVPVGLALIEAKALANGGGNEVGQENIQRYSLIGDPAMRLATPRYRIEIEVADTVRALQEVEASGRIFREDGSAATDFTGLGLVRAFDSTASTKLDHVSFLQPGTPIFRGIATIEGGRFGTSFRVPKDITYGGKLGRISVYAWSDSRPAASGSSADIVLAGTDPGAIADAIGPDIAIRFAGQQEQEGGILVSSNPMVVATISDPSGVNVTGETGHEISLFVDDVLVKVTNAFINDTGDYRTGRLEYRIPALDPGEHVIRLKAWDTFNNSSESEVEVRVGEADDAIITNLLFYPNPLDAGTGNFTFELSEPVTNLRIQVFSLGGRLVAELEATSVSGYNQVAWTPSPGLANGTYLYRVEIEKDGSDGRPGRADRTAVLQLMR